MLETLRDATTWVIIIFLTGLIAGFGKLLASWIVRRQQKRKEITTPARHGPEALPGPRAGAEPPGPIQAQPNDPAAKKIAKEEAKIRKKMQKEEVKRRKRAGD